MNEKAERINGWAAMIGVVAAMGSYAVSGQIIPGVWQVILLYFTLKVNLNFAKYLYYNTGIW